jgi:hypothetical protein
MSVRATTDLGAEIDRVDLVHTAGAGRADVPPNGTPSSWRTHIGSGLSVPGHVVA